MQCLTQEDEIDTIFCNRRLFQIAQPVLEILEAMFLRQLRTELDHLRRVVDCDHFARALGQQLGKCSFTRAKIDNGQARNERDQRVRERPPGTSRDITAAKLSGQFVKIFARSVLTFAQSELQRGPVARGFGHFAREGFDNLLHPITRAVAARASSRAVINIFSRATIYHDPGAFQLREMTGDARLAHVQDLLELGHRKLFFFQQEQQSQASRIRQQPQQING